MEPKPDKQTTSRTSEADRPIREYYESQPPSESEAFPDPLEMVPSSSQRAGKADRPNDDLAELSGGDPDTSQQGIDAGMETPGGSNPTPDQDLVDDIGKAAGVMYQDNEPLNFGEKEARRDNVRWELNPASSEDYQERQAPPEGNAPTSIRSGKDKDSRN